MAKGTINKVILIGRLGQDPETRYLPSGTPVINFSVATNENWKNSDGEKQEKTDWHRISAFGKLAEIVQKYAHKGDRIYIEGRLSYRTYEDNEGTTRHATSVIAETIQLLGEKMGNSESVPDDSPEPKEDDNYVPF
ncbi:MAG: single-stranded DNA-binding protein [Candidatus Methanofastidiosum methylothiophilum]|uniref:Single-stranded DNA-binding protein n=1 Tax=Candidatus Methanofastidiosum methylothiophilum TaxID=1705564 RepID=A0A150ISL4_9EURY|nr:MAG: single-stranded DNA-binding protein [Candidatus Methanofastidiosum methylthiophilus]KYC53538.1 MAG: single-stranded DNA-binding protein [Candidatus Methanofastidiosum methylthiophilus]